MLLALLVIAGRAGELLVTGRSSRSTAVAAPPASSTPRPSRGSPRGKSTDYDDD
jgi:hypothetical protein